MRLKRLKHLLPVLAGDHIWREGYKYILSPTQIPKPACLCLSFYFCCLIEITPFILRTFFFQTSGPNTPHTRRVTVEWPAPRGPLLSYWRKTEHRGKCQELSHSGLGEYAAVSYHYLLILQILDWYPLTIGDTEARTWLTPSTLCPMHSTTRGISNYQCDFTNLQASRLTCGRHHAKSEPKGPSRKEECAWN